MAAGELKMFSILFALLIGTGASPNETPECECGYGGLCLKGKSRDLNRTSCTLCKDLWSPKNPTLYRDCDVIVDHCSSNPCSDGECIGTIGSYFCRCPKDKFGQRCNITDPVTGKLQISSEIYVYYQLQPNHEGLNEFTVIYDVDNFDKGKDGFYVKIAVSDGRLLYPVADHFRYSNVRRTCWKETKENPGVFDERLCYLLPEGDVWSFKFKTNLPIEQNTSDLKYLPEFEKPVGRVGNVNISINWKDAGRQIEFYHSHHEIFSYYLFRLPHRCLDEINFRGCSTDPTKPTRYRSNEVIYVFSIHNPPHCRGVQITGNRWFVQKHVNHPHRTIAFRLPEVIEDLNNKRAITIPSMFFNKGVHMLLFEHNMRGEAPHYGGTQEFSSEHYCWIQTVRTSIDFGMEDGVEMNVYCHRPMRWRIVSLDRGYDENHFHYQVTCDHPNDSECKPRILTSPVLTKEVTPCGKMYNFSIVAVDQYLTVRNVTFSAVAHFGKSRLRLIIDCLWNCYPSIDPNHRAVIVARTMPHVGNKVSWNIVVSNASHSFPFTDFYDDFDVFFNSTASRIIRVDGYKLLRVHENFDSVRMDVTVSRKYGDHVVLNRVIADCPNLNRLRSLFVLRREKNGEYVFDTKLDKLPRSLQREKTRYRVFTLSHGIHDGFYTECDTTYYEPLKFKPTGSRVMMCLSNPDMVTYCTGIETVEPFKSESNCNVQCLQQTRDSGDLKTFLKTMLQYLTKALRPVGDKETGWSITPRERIELVYMMRGLTLLDQDDTALAISVLSLMVYSKEGCASMKPPLNFQDEPALLRNTDAIINFVKLMELTLETIGEVTSRFLLENSDSAKLIVTVKGYEATQHLVRAGKLAWLNYAAIVKQSYEQIHSADFKIGEILYWTEENMLAMTQLVNTCLTVILHFTTMFTGLRVTGSSSVRTYTAVRHYREANHCTSHEIISDIAWYSFGRTTYKQILNYLDRKAHTGPRNETFYHHADYISGPAAGGHEDEEEDYPRWLSMCEVQFPDGKLVPELGYQIFTIAVFLAAGGPRGLSLTPIILIDLRVSKGPRLEIFPRSHTYNITLPILNGTEPVPLDKSEYAVFEDLLNIPKSDKPSTSYFVYKITIPVQMKEYDFIISFSERIQIKAVVATGRIPDSDEFSDLPDLPMIMVKKSLKAKMTVRSSQKESYFQTFYLALLLSQKVFQRNENSTVNIRLDKAVITCILLDTFNDRLSTCVVKDTCKHLEEAGCNFNVTCMCREFGMVHTQVKHVKSTRLLTEPINITTPDTPTPGIIICCVLIATVLALWLWGVFLDVHSNKRASLNHLHDADHPYHRHQLVIGVYTGSNPLSGTFSNVAIQVVGDKSSSRVHILKSFSKKTLSWNEDDWFVTTIEHPLGLITHIHLWLDFRLNSSWYCSQIFVYDVSESIWYLAKVERWFKLDPSGKTSQTAFIPAEEIDPTSSDKSQSFSSYYFRELSVSHLPLSILHFHNRCLATGEQICLLYMLKILSVFVLVWYISEFRSDAFNKTIVNRSSVLWASYVAFLSHIISSPLKLIHRYRISHGFYQRRVTNPIRFYVGRERVHEGHEWTPRSRVARLRECLSKTLRLMMGPEQFRCVNIHQQFFNKLLWWGTLGFRVATISVMTILLGIIIVTEIFTDYWIHYTATLLAASMALITDAFVIEPMVIFIRSLISYSIMKLRNNDLRLWYEGEKLDQENPYPLSLTHYLEMALSNEYKPLTTEGLQRKRLVRKYLTFCWWCLFYFILGVFAVSFLTATSFRDVPMRFFINDVIHRTQSSTRVDPKFGPEAKYVVNVETMIQYVTENQAWLARRWYNRRRNISRGHRSEALVPMEFDQWYPVTRAPFSPEYPKTESIHMHTSFRINSSFEYQEVSSATVTGRTRTPYPLRGHVQKLVKYPWPVFYKNLKVFLVLFFNRGYRRPEALILSSEYFCASFPSILRVDIIVENHFTGLFTAKTQARLLPLSIESHTLIPPGHTACIALGFFGLLLLNAFIICQQGIVEYFTRFDWVLKAAFLVVGGWGVVQEYELAHEIPHNYEAHQNPSQKSGYPDYYHIYDGVENTSSFILGVMYLLICVEALTCVRRLRNRDLLKGNSLWCSRFVGALFLMVMIILIAIEEVEDLWETRMSPLVLFLLTKQLLPVDTDNEKYTSIELIPLMIAMIMLKACGGIVIAKCCRYQYLREPKTSSIERLQDARATSELTSARMGASGVDNEQTILDRRIHRLHEISRLSPERSVSKYLYLGL